MKERIEKLAATIKENGDTVPDHVCTDLWSLMQDCMDKDLQQKIWTIWRNSRCSNGDLPRLALEMLAATMDEKKKEDLEAAVKLMAEIHAAKIWHYAATAREGRMIPAGWTIPDDSGLIGRIVAVLATHLENA